MSRFFARFFLLIFPAAFASAAWAQSQPATHIADASSRTSAKGAGIAPIHQQLFGGIPLSTKSEEARKSIESAWGKYENAMYDASADDARRASQKDANSALAYAMISFAARRTTPDTAALAKAKSLLSRTSPDEQLLVRWMTAIQERDLLPAISSMNDLLKRYPRDKHILYVTGEWLFIQQDDDHAQALLESALKIDPDFPAALNRLGYLYIRSVNPDPQKALASLNRYAQVETASSNPQDSLGEVSRIAGDDAASLRHFSASLHIDPTFLASQEGLGDTRTLMGDFDGARKEYDRALQMAKSPVDELYIKGQRALVSFWEGNPEQGHKELAAFAEQAAQKKEPNGQFNIAFARAMLASDWQSELNQLKELSAFLEKPHSGMLEYDRKVDLAMVLRERVRVAALNSQSNEATQGTSQLETLATATGDVYVQACYETARGYTAIAQKDFQNATEELAADPHSPLALQQLAVAQLKLGNKDAVEATLTRLKYQRGPTVEWFLVRHANKANKDQGVVATN
jgi:tetratricopeptide (TPR) repeat protein